MSTGLTVEPNLPLVHRGKVRDTYALGDDLLMVATDRLSAFDVVLPTPIPGKGIVLTSLAAFWFTQMGSLVPNHVITSEMDDIAHQVGVPATALAGRAMLVRRAERIDVECVVRGYLAGSGWTEYQTDGSLAGEPLPAGLKLGDPLPEPRFTPSLKMDTGHDVNVSRTDIAGTFGQDLAEQLERTSLNLYAAAAAFAATRQLILADTKFEFGFVDGELTLIDEILTPDSSRYWDLAAWVPGATPPSFDKQYVRDFLASTGWDRQPPGPELPAAVVSGTQQRYREAYRRVTGRDLKLSHFQEPGDIPSRPMAGE